MTQHPWVNEDGLQELPTQPTPQMLLAGARSIGNSMRADNHTERSAACWKAMCDAYYNGTEEPEPKNESRTPKS